MTFATKRPIDATDTPVKMTIYILRWRSGINLDFTM